MIVPGEFFGPCWTVVRGPTSCPTCGGHTSEWIARATPARVVAWTKYATGGWDARVDVPDPEESICVQCLTVPFTYLFETRESAEAQAEIERTTEYA